MNTLRRWYHDVVVSAFLWLGTRIYSTVLAKPEDNEVKAVHFAENERELNISMRDYVDELDKPERTGER